MYLQKTPGLFLIVVLTTLVSSEHNSDQQDHKACTDDEGNIILHGWKFIPKIDDPCTKCTCDNGYQILCHTAACSPPVGCVKTEQIPRECCRYHCLDADGNTRSPSANDSVPVDGQPTASEDNITNLSLRLVASTVTSFLVLALLLFMVHRLRQRRLMLAMRRFEAQARGGHGDDDLDHYIPAEFMQIECPPYEDPPPPYSPPKPPHILPEDSPPPYEEVENNAADQVDTNGNVNNNNNNNQSCIGHRSEGTVVSSSGGERGEIQHQHHIVVENQARERASPHVADIIEGFNAAANLCHNSGQRYAGENLFETKDNMEQTCLKTVARPGDFGNRQPSRVVDSMQRSA